MIHGIGTDILEIAKITTMGTDYNDPFFLKTFTKSERDQAAARPDPGVFFATRFAAKEAVFKCFGMDGNRIRLDDIEIITDESGAPGVNLHGMLKKTAENFKITKINLSLSWDGTYAVAFAVAEV